MGGAILLTHADAERLRVLVRETQGIGNRADAEGLVGELAKATVVETGKMPSNVVTMNSKVKLRNLDTSEEITLSLVYPEDADLSSGSVSVLAPVGTAILGYVEGDIIEWPVPSGVRLRIEKILYQPEAAGNAH
ncbi:MAG: nucleoside diphosphate kinase regulator [Coriobacteriia bacterium]